MLAWKINQLRKEQEIKSKLQNEFIIQEELQPKILSNDTTRIYTGMKDVGITSRSTTIPPKV